MRVSCDRTDPGYTEVTDWLILLNSVELADCITADEERGLVEVYRREPGGAIMVDERTGEAVTVRRRGRVEIRRRG